MNYSITHEKLIFNDHYKIVEAEVTYETFDGSFIKTRRLAFERGNSVAAVIVEKETNSILLTKQFRYPTCKESEGWMLEIPAGSIEKDEEPIDCLKREIMEELGYKIKSPEHLQTFYASPGASTERIFLFYATVSEKDKIGKGGGNQNEMEDIQIIKIPIEKISEEIGKIKDAKTILALQWFLLKRQPKK
jgi:ADP-ribose pyrophosphatase